LGDFLNDVVKEMAATARQKNVAIELALDQSDAHATGDKDRLKQVLVNLIDNAIKYNHPGGRVVVSCRSLDGEVIISVTDTGIGIPEEHRSRIFERFYRVDKQRSRDAGGTGLGLAIVKHIVEAHGSVVKIESSVGNGSTFSFTLKV
jgi:two-component system, OmpR family, phosphate regulon sensor histidine kinase PhoR